MKQIFPLIAAVLAGFVGGVLSTRMMPPRESQGPAQSIRAHSFELLDESGQTISYWGIDKGQNAVLAFGSHWPLNPVGGGTRPNIAAQPLDNPENQRAAIGVIDDLPFLYLRALDGKTRVRLYLSAYGKPMLLMEDETRPRVSLGIEQSDTPGPEDNDWTLDFGPENRARLGMYTEREGGQTYIRGIFSVKKDKVKYP